MNIKWISTEKETPYGGLVLLKINGYDRKEDDPDPSYHIAYVDYINPDETLHWVFVGKDKKENGVTYHQRSEEKLYWIYVKDVDEETIESLVIEKTEDEKNKIKDNPLSKIL